MASPKVAAKAENGRIIQMTYLMWIVEKKYALKMTENCTFMERMNVDIHSENWPSIGRVCTLWKNPCCGMLLIFQ